MSSVTLESVSLAFPGGGLGLADIDLAIGDGEFIALLGPSGSGKTTLLRTIAGFSDPTAGTVSIDEQIVAGRGRSVSPEHRGLGMVFQQHAVWPHWNVFRNVEYPLRRAGIARAERARRVSETLDRVGLAGFERRSPATLSGGQRQRVAIARAIVSEPRVLLLDEALSALDEPLRDRLRLELRELTRSLGLTVVHVTHDRAEALALADRVVVLDAGRVQQIGTPEQLVREPADAFVATFLSDAAIVRGRVEGGAFVGRDHPLRIERDALDLAGCADADAQLDVAILPEHLSLVEDPAGAAVVRSSLFGRDGDDVVVDFGGLVLRSRVGGQRMRPGVRVAVRVERALGYPVVPLGAVAAAEGR